MMVLSWASIACTAILLQVTGAQKCGNLLNSINFEGYGSQSGKIGIFCEACEEIRVAQTLTDSEDYFVSLQPFLYTVHYNGGSKFALVLFPFMFPSANAISTVAE
jgi:hypothetical protein